MGNKVIDPVGLREGLKDLTLVQLKEKYVEYGIEDLWKNGTNKAIAVDIAVKAITEKPSKDAGAEKPESESSESQDDGQEDTGSEDEIEPGEYEVDQDTLDEYPALVEQGFNIGDILVIEEGKPWYKKEDVVRERSIEEVDADIKEQNANIKPEDITDPTDIPANGPHKERNLSKDAVDSETINGVSRETINSELADLNGGAVESEYVPAVEEDEEEILDGNEVVKEYVPEVIDESKFTEEEFLENIEICQANLKDALPQTRITLLRKLEALEAALERKRK